MFPILQKLFGQINAPKLQKLRADRKIVRVEIFHNHEKKENTKLEICGVEIVLVKQFEVPREFFAEKHQQGSWYFF